ncbi:L-serine dehydratase [Neorhodopirellula lusitana]|uniref:L-serine ammonia-lyase n=1 Tax=Neorhodopirellula lusitana TaxID=445327 RepID=A0ABY1QNR3_9BACT|nr:L-serine ammonia-lyase, iron-sulfur-dependent, subunit alpha [Neorhodopirellula lusitana]SMP75917.1 L-serine dehydratase [Neorhodopirellula lusitana]
MLVSIFNDVIGPVMRGPSSSHCAAALRIGRLARDMMSGQFTNVLIEFDQGGSLPNTHDSQGSDMGLFGGLLGWDAADERLPGSFQTFRDLGIPVSIETVDVGDPHPNTYRLTLDNEVESLSMRAISTGGGMIEVIDIDGFPVSMFGDCFETLIWVNQDAEALAEVISANCDVHDVTVHTNSDSGKSGQLIQVKADEFVDEVFTDSASGVQRVKRLAPVLPVLSRKTTKVPFTTCEEMLAYDAGRGTPLWKLAIQYETSRGGLTEEEVIAKMVDIVRIIRRSIADGIAGTQYDDRVLGHQCGRFEEKMRAGELLDSGGSLNRIILYVTALMEVKSSMGVIVAAPTAGACAALPGTIVAIAETLELDERAMAKALLASGMIGVFIATRWSFAAEVGGCQAEGGSAACMAASGLVNLLDGPLNQSLAASSMALQSMIGLICDPVANRVEVPCLGKNVMAATNALSCANMAMSGYDPVIPLDEVIETAKQVSKQMPRELRCTNLGGLSMTPTAIALEKKLADGRAASCGGGCGCAAPAVASVASVGLASKP